MASYFADKQIDGFISKPCDPADLLTEVSRIIFLRGDTVRQPASALPAVLAESDHVLNETLTQALTQAGCAVKSCFTGPDAIEAVISTRPVVVILRLELGGMSADEVCRLLRRLPGTRATPVVVYGVDVPGVQLEHVAALEEKTTRFVKDLSVNQIVQTALSAVRL
jgi:CheY-like chemotaxis protein